MLCAFVGQQRGVFYYHAKKKMDEREVKQVALLEVLQQRFKHVGSKKLAKVAKRDHDMVINHKRVSRLRKKHDLLPRKKKKIRARVAVTELPIPRVDKRNQIWAIDFMSSRQNAGTKFRLLNVMDVHTRVAIRMTVGVHMGTEKVLSELREAISKHGVPEGILSDNGVEFRSHDYVNWCEAHGIKVYFTKKATPVQNCFVESFNGSVRREMLNDLRVKSVKEASTKIADWQTYYNSSRPHGSLDFLTPERYALNERTTV